MPCAPFAAHQFIDVSGRIQPQHFCLHAFGLGLQVESACAVVAQVAQDVMQRRMNELARNRQPQPAIAVMPHLLDQHEAGVQILARVKRSGVVAIVVEEMHRDLMLRQEVEQTRVQF